MDEARQSSPIVKCEKCHKTTIVLNEVKGQIVCTSCGLVKARSVIDETLEVRNFGAGDSGPQTLTRIGGAVDPYL